MSREELQQKSLAEAVLRYEGYIEMAASRLVNHYGIHEEAAIAMRLGVVADPFPQHRNMSMRLCIPYLDANDGIASLKFRCLLEHDCKEHSCPKYLGEEGSEPRLFGVKCLTDSEATTLVVVEGELDQGVAHHEVGLCAIGYPGTGSWSSLFTRAVGPDYERVLVVADGDEAGRNAAKKVAKELKGQVVHLPDGEDLSSLYVKRGREGLLAVLGLSEEPEPEQFPF